MNEKAKNGIANVIVSFSSATLAIWTLAQPIAEHALAGEIERQVAPLKKQINSSVEAQIVQLSATIRGLHNSIAAQEYKRDTCRTGECWTARDNIDLSNTKDELVAAQQALDRLEASR